MRNAEEGLEVQVDYIQKASMHRKNKLHHHIDTNSKHHPRPSGKSHHALKKYLRAMVLTQDPLTWLVRGVWSRSGFSP